MHCGVMVTGYNQGDWERLLAEDYSRPPAVSDAANMDDTLYLGELVEPLGFDSIWATEHYGSAYSGAGSPPTSTPRSDIRSESLTRTSTT